MIDWDTVQSNFTSNGIYPAVQFVAGFGFNTIVGPSSQLQYIDDTIMYKGPPVSGIDSVEVAMRYMVSLVLIRQINQEVFKVDFSKYSKEIITMILHDKGNCGWEYIGDTLRANFVKSLTDREQEILLWEMIE